ncbi:MAG TPA: hypothetical protein VE650_03260 [Acetobacteraceae bacterium]|nr:hypothetical protein [Acetobacteraceae bacterium]
MNDTEAPPPSGGSTGDFFAVDRRAWAYVCRLGMNPAVAYLVLARGTGGDNRTTKWSVNAIERRTSISRSRAAKAIADLEQAKVVIRDPASRSDRPKYKITPAHEIPGCEGFPPAALDAGEREMMKRISSGVSSFSGMHTPERSFGNRCPSTVLRSLAAKGWAQVVGHDTYKFAPYDAEAAAKPDWIWLPNALVDGAGAETAPVELVRLTGSAPTLRLLVDLYGAQNLDEDGGIHFRHIRQEYERLKVGERGPYVVWGFVPRKFRGRPDAPFIAPHLAGKEDEEGWKGFWACWDRLYGLGLVELVDHLVHANTAEGEVIHPMAFDGTGLEVEREVARAAERAALTMITQGQHDWAAKQGVATLAPVLRHIEGVQMFGIARLRYRPRTSRTLAFAAREAEWRELAVRMAAIVQGAAA